MPQTSRELVYRCLNFEYPERIPRDLWFLPWAVERYPEAVAEINRRFPSDFVTTDYFYPPSPRVKGDPYKIGSYTDEWGCVFVNYQNGVIGEVKEPLIADIRDWRTVQPPYEQLPENIASARKIINDFYASSDKFVFANCCPRPWERYQFLRGSENAMIDVMMPEEGGRDLLRLIHEFYLKELEFWVQMDVDAIKFMDDWGAQNQLLIPPRIWRELFKPLYKDYCDLAHAHGKFAFMHSDGHITEIYDDLIEIGVDAINSQLFCMDFEELEQKARGKITFWGEIDRQHVLPSPNPEDGREAVRKVAQHFYDPRGGVIAQFEFGAGANPATALVIFDEWEKIV
ncbi:MAG: methyltransferase [candidate division KSB1 bacterium]|nr:methyltransferase [candidate division KSB1 bacterium]MDZ7341563.1 methyltransferase [candidate division KSB1 bacterium]